MSNDDTEWLSERTVSLGAADLSAAQKDSIALRSENQNLTGKVLCDKFELTAFIGSGGMSEVYKARHLVTGKTVAVKILHQKLAKDEITSKRLKQEAQAAGALTHPNILSVHDFGVDSTGTPFLVMDFIDGVSLSEILKTEGPLPLDRFFTIMQQVASALAHAQDQNIVHRDLKPSNIMILNTGGKDQSMIVDFGIAKMVDPDNEVQKLTQTGELFGSPLYMSPEQCTGSEVDPRSDIYAFGCVMYEALSGKTPHMGETVFDTIHRHINSSPAPLIAPHIEASMKDRLEGIMLKCLAKAPGDRYQSAATIQAELRKLELSEASNIITQIGSAFSLAQAKLKAKKKTNVPLLVVSLFSVAALSVMASIFLMVSLKDYGECNHNLITSNKILNGYGEMFNHLGFMYRASELYLLQRDPHNLQTYNQYKAATQNTFLQIEGLMKDQPKKLASFRRRELVLNKAMELIYEDLRKLPAQGGGFSDFASDLPSFTKMAQMLNREQFIIDQLHEQERDTLNRLSVKVEEAQRKVTLVGMFAIALNSGVLITMIVYFVRNRPKRTKLQLEDSSKPVGERATEGGNKEEEIAGLENLLQELASSLSAAEQREQFLLSRLQKRPGEDTGSLTATNNTLSRRRTETQIDKDKESN